MILRDQSLDALIYAARKLGFDPSQADPTITAPTGPTGPTGPAGAAGATSGDRQIVVSCFGSTKATAGGKAWTYAATQGDYADGAITNSTTPAQNDFVNFWDVWLDAGTWQLDLMGQANVDGGQITAALVGGSTVAFNGATSMQEQYAATSGAIRTTLTGVAVATAGLYSLKLIIATRNASSSSWRCRMSECVLTRIA